MDHSDRNVEGDAPYILQRQHAAFHQVLQRGRQVLHHHAVVRRYQARAVKRRNVGMAQLRHELYLAQERPEGRRLLELLLLGALRVLGVEELDCHRDIAPGAVLDNAERSRAERAVELQVTELDLPLGRNHELSRAFALVVFDVVVGGVVLIAAAAILLVIWIGGIVGTRCLRWCLSSSIGAARQAC